MKIRNFISNYGGILAGALYATAMRLIFHIPYKGFEFDDLFSVGFVWIVPIIIGVIPIIFAQEEQLQSPGYRSLAPVWSVLVFFVVCFFTRIEDLLCIVIIAFPFLAVASVAGTITGRLILRYRVKKDGKLYSLLLLPLLVGVLEPRLPQPSDTFTICSKVTINSSPQKIWNNVVRVKPINEAEYRRGFYNYAGIPRPLYAELDRDTLGATRIGHFEGGLQFRETVKTWERNKKVSFDITVIPSSIRQTIFDRHILKGGHFQFVSAEYQLKSLSANQTELSLTSSYRLDSRVNNYASFWGNSMLTDFQERLLYVIKNRCNEK